MEIPEDWSLDKFLPLTRMRSVGESARATYSEAKPFPHLVFDDFFAPELLDIVLEEFPNSGDIAWQRFNDAREIKLASPLEASFGPATRLLFYHLNSMTFLDWLTQVTGIENLIPDPGLEGGGLHQILPGGKLGVHADFNKHRRYGLDRRLNLLVYLNKEWREEYGGDLQLWNSDMTECAARVSPIFNRVMLFGTTDFTYHGHPDPLLCPKGMTRKSLALYYFSNGRPSEEITGEHSTLFRARHKDEFQESFGQRVRKVAKDILPPIVSRQLKRLL